MIRSLLFALSLILLLVACDSAPYSVDKSEIPTALALESPEGYTVYQYDAYQEIDCNMVTLHMVWRENEGTATLGAAQFRINNGDPGSTIVDTTPAITTDTGDPEGWRYYHYQVTFDYNDYHSGGGTYWWGAMVYIEEPPHDPVYNYYIPGLSYYKEYCGGGGGKGDPQT